MTLPFQSEPATRASRLDQNAVRQWRVPLLRPLGETQLQRLEPRARALAMECGCTAGGAASLSALVAYLAVRSVAVPTEPGRVMRAWLTGAAIVVFAGVLAKAVAIVVARIRLRRLLREIPSTAIGPAMTIPPSGA